MLVKLRSTSTPHHLQNICDREVYIALGLAIKELSALSKAINQLSRHDYKDVQIIQVNELL
jgi:hypothetical protein